MSIWKQEGRRGPARLAAVVVLAGAVLAGCMASVAPQGPAVPPPGGAGPAAGATLGDGPIRVALIVPASGSGNAPSIAADLRNAADLALRQSGSDRLQILVKDDRGTAEGARAATAEAVGEGAEMILGPLFAPSVAAAAAVARPAGVPVIAFSTDATVAARGVYLLSFLPQGDVERIVGFAASRGKRAVAALLPSNGYGAVVEAALQHAAASNGSRVIAIERYGADPASMQPRAAAVARLVLAGEVDAVFVPDAADVAAALARMLAQSGVEAGRVQLLGSGQWDDPRVAGEPALRGAWYPAPDRAGFTAFAARYQGAFGSPPLRTAALAYDATTLAAGLAGRFGDNRFAFETITNPNGFLGVDGAFRFLADGTSQRGLAVYRLDAGGAAIIDAAPRSFTRTP